MRNLEGRELSRSGGSAKGKPKIEAYDKDRKKGAGGLIAPAKVHFLIPFIIPRFPLHFFSLLLTLCFAQTYNPSADAVLGQTPNSAAGIEEDVIPKKRKKEAEPSLIGEVEEEAPVTAEQKKEKKKKKKKTDEEGTAVSNEGNDATEQEGEGKAKKDKKKKKHD